MCPKQGMEPCQKHIQAQRKRQSYIRLARGRMGCSFQLRQQKSQRKEILRWIPASMHMVSKRDLNSAELETMRMSRSPTTVMTANGEVQTREEAAVYVERLDLFVKLCSLKKLPQFFPWGHTVRIMGITHHWTSGQKPHLIRNDKRIICNFSKCVPFVVPGLSASSSSTALLPTSSTSSSLQDSVFDVSRFNENPATERSGSTSGELRGDPLHESTETENKNKNEEREKKYKETFRIGRRSSERIWSMNAVR